MKHGAEEVDDIEPDIPEGSETYESINLPIATSKDKVGDGLTRQPLARPQDRQMPSQLEVDSDDFPDEASDEYEALDEQMALLEDS